MMFKKKEFAPEADTMNKSQMREEDYEMNDTSNDAETENIVKQWQRDAEQLKLLVPDFSLETAIKNPLFAEALKKGATVFEAYKETSAAPKPEKREEIFQNARSARRGTGGASVNPAKLSSDEFKKYIENIKNA